jgi:arsenate reductase
LQEPETTENKVRKVLYLCAGNSARSILGEALINHLGTGRFRGYSAGSYPSGEVHPLALETLRQHCLPTAGLRSKHWDEFGREESPVMDFILTVCDNAVAEVCPIWPGRPASTHWGIADPAAVLGNMELSREAFNQSFRQLEERIKRLVSLEPGFLDPVALRQALDDIGRVPVTDETGAGELRKPA